MQINLQKPKQEDKPHRIMKTIEWTVFSIFLVVIIVLLSPFLPTKRFLASYVIVSGSMEPTVPKGSLVFIQPVPFEQINKGDIIGFTSPRNKEDLIVHRVNDISSDGGLITKGDNNDTIDRWTVTNTHYQGKYVMDIPYVGFATAFMQTPKGFALMIGIPTLFLVFLQLLRIKEGIEEEIQKRTREEVDKMQKQSVINSIS